MYLLTPSLSLKCPAFCWSRCAKVQSPGATIHLDTLFLFDLNLMAEFPHQCVTQLNRDLVFSFLFDSRVVEKGCAKKKKKKIQDSSSGGLDLSSSVSVYHIKPKGNTKIVR